MTKKHQGTADAAWGKPLIDPRPITGDDVVNLGYADQEAVNEALKTHRVVIWLE